MIAKPQAQVIVGLRSAFPSLLIAWLLICPAHKASAQGCSQCRDNLAATSPATQAAYRRAILLLMTAGGAVFLAATLILKRYR